MHTNANERQGKGLRKAEPNTTHFHLSCQIVHQMPSEAVTVSRRLLRR